MKRPCPERLRQLQVLDQWFQRLHAEHPVLFNLLAVGIALMLFGFAVLFKWMLKL